MLYKGIVIEVIAFNTLAQNRNSKKARHYIIIQAWIIPINVNLLTKL
jgi:hypothetical protein